MTMDVNEAPRDRIEREASFHDHSFANNIRADVDEYYVIAQRSVDYFLRRIAERSSGAHALEYGCGTGDMARNVLAQGADHVTGIDISPKGIQIATERARAAGEADRLDFRVMNAEQLEFPDETFDLIYGRGILHHLDLERSYAELARVLRPGGVVIMSEPLGHNPAINWYRNRTPELRTADEHPLMRRDIEHARRHFDRVETRYFHLLSLGLIPLRRTPLLRMLYPITEAVDRIAMGTVPPLRSWAWIVVLEMGKNRE